MTESRPDTDERAEPGGTPPSGPHDLTDRPAEAGIGDTGAPAAVPGAYDADEGEQERGEAVEPGN